MVEGQLAITCKFALLLFNSENMIAYRNINANEGGLSVRAKINNMFAALISGDEGVNNVWKRLIEVTNGFSSLELSVGNVYDELKEQVLKSFDYTDSTAEDLRTYINGMNGGISGFAVDTSFNPDFPEDKAATVLAVGAGTYVNMLDVYGDPITIEDADALTVFYKGANSTYWQYKSIYARVVVDENIDGGNAFTKWGGSKNIDGGTATGGGTITNG